MWFIRFVIAVLGLTLLQEKFDPANQFSHPSCFTEASFECSKAKSADELLICWSNKARYADCRLGLAYDNAVSATTSPEQKQSLSRQQRSWILKRNKSCGTDLSDASASCFVSTTNDRLLELVRKYSLDKSYTIHAEPPMMPLAPIIFGAVVILAILFVIFPIHVSASALVLVAISPLLLIRALLSERAARRNERLLRELQELEKARKERYDREQADWEKQQYEEAVEEVMRREHAARERQQQGQSQNNKKPEKNISEIWYQILEVSQDASQEDITNAYKRLIKLYHPDKFKHLGTDFERIATEKAQELGAAYDYAKSIRCQTT